MTESTEMTADGRDGEPAPTTDHHPRQEQDVVRAWMVVVAIIFTLAVIAGGILWAWGLLDSEMARARAGVALRYGPPPETRPRPARRLGGLLQGPVGRGWGERETPHRLSPAEDLESWSWADSQHRYARIPIERAMAQIVAREGARAAQGPTPPQDSPQNSPQTRPPGGGF